MYGVKVSQADQTQELRAYSLTLVPQAMWYAARSSKHEKWIWSKLDIEMKHTAILQIGRASCRERVSSPV